MGMQKRNVQKILAMLLAVAVWHQPCVWAQEEKADDTKQNKITAQQQEEEDLLTAAGIMPLAFDPSSIYDETTGSISIAGTANGDSAVAIGKESKSSMYGVAIGNKSVSSIYGVTIGNEAKNDTYGVAIGNKSHAGKGGVGIGDGASSYDYGVAIGRYSKVTGGYGIAVGYSSNAGNSSVAIGVSTKADSYESVAIGYRAKSNGHGIAIGSNANAGEFSVAIGNGAYVDRRNTISFGDVRNDKNIYRDVEGVKNLAMNGGLYFGEGSSPDDLKVGELRGVTKINGLAFDNDTINGVQFGAGGVVSGVDTINGVSIKNDGGNIVVGGIDLSALQKAGGIVTENTKGITRTESTPGSGKYVTTIEDNTKITQNGVETNNIDADKGTIGGVSFDGNGVISNVDKINGIRFADGNINGVSIGKDNNDDVIVGGINLSDLQDGKIVSENTKGIERKDGNTTVIEGAAAFDENGMNISKEKVESDGDGNTTTTANSSKVTDGSVSVSTQTVTKDKDGKETTVTNSVTLENGDIKLDKVDASGNRETMYVGEEIRGINQEIDGIKDDMREMGRSINKLGKEVDEVGALSAALAGLHPNPENANSRADLAMAIGSYDGEQAIAVGGFYRADKRTMFSVGASATSSKQMFNMGVSIALDKMPEAERREKEIKQAAVNNETLQAVVAALQELKADNAEMKARYEKLSADYEALKAKYEI